MTLADGSSKTEETCTWYEVIFDERTDNFSLLAGGAADEACTKVFAELGIPFEGQDAVEAMSGSSS